MNKKFKNDFGEFMQGVTPNPKKVNTFKFNLIHYVDDEYMTNYFNLRIYDFKTLAELYKGEELNIKIRYKGEVGDFDKYSISLNKYQDNVINKNGEHPSIDDYKLYDLIIKAVNDRYTRYMCTLKYGHNYNEVCRL